MLIKTSTLTGSQLDWAVAKCEGADFHHVGNVLCVLWTEKFDVRLTDYNPSTNWAQGGPILEREFIATLSVETNPCERRWAANPNRVTQTTFDDGGYPMDFGGYPMLSVYESRCHYGPTPLIAAMRCRVSSKLGNEVAIPEELI